MKAFRVHARGRFARAMGFLQWFNVWWSLGYVLFTATTATLMLLIPAVCLVRPVSHGAYARVTSLVFACWWTSCLFITERLNGVGVRITGDALPRNTPLLIIANHKCNLDWMFLWSAAVRTGSIWHVGLFRGTSCVSQIPQTVWPYKTRGECRRSTSDKADTFLAKLKTPAVAKRELRVIPFFGWGCKLNGFAYISRKWSADSEHLKTWANTQFAKNAPGWVVIFPEGTRYTEANKQRSDVSCARDGIDVGSLSGEILRPKTKGLALLLRENEKQREREKESDGTAVKGTQKAVKGTPKNTSFGVIVDMTIQYTDSQHEPVKGSALGTRCFGQLAKGSLPVRTCHVHFDVFDPGSVPTGDEPCNEWVLERWRKKAALLRSCAEFGQFQGVSEWSASGGSVPFVLQTFLRVFFVAQGLTCVALLAYQPLFVAYAAVALGGLGLMCQLDPPTW